MTTMAESLKKLEGYTFDYFINEMLGQVPENIDQREGSIIYDSLAPVAYSMAEFVFEVKKILENAYTQTAFGEFLDFKAYEQGLAREQASHSQAMAVFSREDNSPYVVALGDRFASLGDEPIFYKVIESHNKGTAILEAEEVGSQSAGYTGIILPVTPQNGLTSAYISQVTSPGQDAETDASLRHRLLNNRNDIAFAGNVADYVRIVQAIDGVSYCQVYPTWNGGGTVKLVILDNQLNPASSSLQVKVLNTLEKGGNGYGLVPIGHSVTVTAPEVVRVGVQMNIIQDLTVDLADIRNRIKTVLSTYQKELRQTWSQIHSDRSYQQEIYNAQVISRLMTVEGITTVTNLNFILPDNGGSVNDFPLTFSNTLSQVIEFGEVTVRAEN